MKLLVTLEIEVSDLPQDTRDELMDGLSFRHDDDETLNIDLPTVPSPVKNNELDTSQVQELVGMFFPPDPEYEAQAETWAGSDQYVWFSSFDVKSAEIIGPVPEARQLLDAAEAEGLTVRVYYDAESADYSGKSAALAWDAVTACDEMNVVFLDHQGVVVGWAYILPGLDPDETISDCSGEWVNAWFEKRKQADG